MRKLFILFFFNVLSSLCLAQSDTNDAFVRSDTIYYENNKVNTVHYFDTKDECLLTRKFFNSGKVQVEIERVSTRQIKSLIEWYETGQVRIVSREVGKIKYSFYFHPNGVLEKSFTSKDGIYTDIVNEWWDNGALKTKIDFGNELQDVTYFYPDGQVMIKGRKIYGYTWIGGWIEYYQNGTVKTKGYYKLWEKNEVGYTDKSTPVGVWESFDEHGVLINKTEY